MADYGLNFRQTSGYRTDTGVNSWVSYTAFGNDYPHTLGNGLTCGYTTTAVGTYDARDRSTSNDERLGGIHFQSTSATKTVFRADLPATGGYNIGLALGDAGGGPGYAYMDLQDNGSSLGVLVNTSTAYSTDQFYDATGVKRTSSSDWVTNNATVSKTFSSTIAQFVTQPGGAVADFTRLAHIRITTAGGGGGPGPCASRKTLLGVGM